MLDEITDRYAGRITTKATGREAMENSALVAKLLKEWNAVGSSRADVEAVLGEPTDEAADVLEYRFDGGYDGDVWRFRLKDGRVASVERIPME